MKTRNATPWNLLAAGLLGLAAVAVGCGGANGGPPPEEPGTAEPAAAGAEAPTGGGAGLANPASVNCEQQGGELVMVEGPGGTGGVCTFEDGTRCEEWRYFRGECEPGQCREPNGVCD